MPGTETCPGVTKPEILERIRPPANTVEDMARAPRPQFAGAVYHITANGNRGSAIVLDDVDPRRFVAILGFVASSCGWQCHAVCVMTTHFHLLVTTPRANIAAGMHRLNGRYAQTFNERHGFAGHLFKARYHSVVVVDESHFFGTYRYIAQNPVEAGACRSPADWRWSSYAALVNGRTLLPGHCERILEHFGTGPAALRRLRRFVEGA